MNKEDLIKFKSAFLIIGVGLIVTIVIMTKVFPQVMKIPQLSKDIKSQLQQLDDDKRRLADEKKKLEEPAVKEEDNQLYKAFFESSNAGLSSEAVLGLEFEEILQEMRKNKIKARSIKYDYNPQEDSFVSGGGGQFQVCKVSMEMIGKYTDFRSFLRDLYAHQHFLEISKVEIAPYTKDKRILLINLQIKIYAKNS